MRLSSRERLGIATVACLALLFLGSRTGVTARTILDLRSAHERLAQSEKRFIEARTILERFRAEFNGIESIEGARSPQQLDARFYTGVTPNEATLLALQALEEAASSAGVTLDEKRIETPADLGEYERLSISVSLIASPEQLSSLLNRVLALEKEHEVAMLSLTADRNAGVLRVSMRVNAYYLNQPRDEGSI